MGLVYFSIPVLAGWYLVDWTREQSNKNIGKDGERLPVKEVKGLGSSRILSVGSDDNVEKRQKVGAGGWGGGVNLAVSDAETQRRNQAKLEKFLQKQRIKIDKDEEGSS